MISPMKNLNFADMFIFQIEYLMNIPQGGVWHFPFDRKFSRKACFDFFFTGTFIPPGQAQDVLESRGGMDTSELKLRLEDRGFRTQHWDRGLKQ